MCCAMTKVLCVKHEPLLLIYTNCPHHRHETVTHTDISSDVLMVGESGVSSQLLSWQSTPLTSLSPSHKPLPTNSKEVWAEQVLQKVE